MTYVYTIIKHVLRVRLWIIINIIIVMRHSLKNKSVKIEKPREVAGALWLQGGPLPLRNTRVCTPVRSAFSMSPVLLADGEENGKGKEKRWRIQEKKMENWAPVWRRPTDLQSQQGERRGRRPATKLSLSLSSWRTADIQSQPVICRASCWHRQALICAPRMPPCSPLAPGSPWPFLTGGNSTEGLGHTCGHRPLGLGLGHIESCLRRQETSFPSDKGRNKNIVWRCSLSQENRNRTPINLFCTLGVFLLEFLGPRAANHNVHRSPIQIYRVWGYF